VRGKEVYRRVLGEGQEKRTATAGQRGWFWQTDWSRREEKQKEKLQQREREVHQRDEEEDLQEKKKNR